MGFFLIYVKTCPGMSWKFPLFCYLSLKVLESFCHVSCKKWKNILESPGKKNLCGHHEFISLMIVFLTIRTPRNSFLSKHCGLVGWSRCPLHVHNSSILVFVPSPIAFSWHAKLKPLNTRELQQTKKRDFIAMNKAATQSGLVTAQEHFQYRATHDVKFNRSIPDLGTHPVKHPSPTAVYGVPTKYVGSHFLPLLVSFYNY